MKTSVVKKKDTKMLDGQLLNADEMIEKYKKMVFKSANSLTQKTPRHIEREDLIQQGLEGLYIAFEKFEDDKGVRFLTFAFPCVQNNMRRYIDSFSPVAASMRTVKIASMIKAQSLKSTPSEEIAELLGVSISVIDRAKRYMECTILSTSAKNDEGEEFVENFFSVSDDFSGLDTNFINNLTKQQLYVLQLSYEGYNARESALKMNCSTANVTYIRKRIREKYKSLSEGWFEDAQKK